nr:carboxypeptidase-like regulatory domain-containing protein [Flavobacteriaceae bacterium]
GDVDFTQFNLKVEHTIKLLRNSSTAFLLQGGIVGGNAPLTHLYNATPNYSLRNPWRKRINFSGTNAFETMTFNEFISERYISLQGRHNFQRFKIGAKFRPRLSLISRFAIGTIDEPQNHIGVNFRKMNEGYLESGFVLNHLFKGFGLSSFYRYGPYSNEKFSDNLAVKLTYVLSLGF